MINIKRKLLLILLILLINVIPVFSALAYDSGVIGGSDSNVNGATTVNKEKGFKLLFLAYACPFLPACVITISQGLSKRDSADFISAVVAGKLVMFFIISYIGKDIIGFITSPIKVLTLALITFIAWKIGNKLNKDLEDYEHKKINED